MINLLGKKSCCPEKDWTTVLPRNPTMISLPATNRPSVFPRVDARDKPGNLYKGKLKSRPTNWKKPRELHRQSRPTRGGWACQAAAMWGLRRLATKNLSQECGLLGSHPTWRFPSGCCILTPVETLHEPHQGAEGQLLDIWRACLAHKGERELSLSILALPSRFRGTKRTGQGEAFNWMRTLHKWFFTTFFPVSLPKEGGCCAGQSVQRHFSQSICSPLVICYRMSPI